jgi:hypothetical protein
MRKPIRRVVTGHDAAGRSVFITDAAAPHVYNRAPGSAVVTELWETRAMPADNSGNDEVTDHPFRLAPPRNGSVFRIVEYPPDKDRVAALERQRASADDGAAFDRRSPRHPGFHKTNSVDCLHRARGRNLADGRGRGAAQGRRRDCNGTNHAWSNRTDAPAYLAFVPSTPRRYRIATMPVPRW